MNIKLTKVDGEGAPLDGGGVEVAVLHVQVARGYRLRAKTIEERHLGPARDTHCKKEEKRVRSQDPGLIGSNSGSLAVTPDCKSAAPGTNLAISPAYNQIGLLVHKNQHKKILQIGFS
jgi:hypothetical protein